jgi:predicted nucleic acid-binding protein
VIAYLDTSFLIKLYVFEVDSHHATELLRRHNCRPMIGWLSEVEMASALHAESTVTQPALAGVLAELAYAEFRLDKTSKVYDLVAMDEEVFERARQLGERYGRKHLVLALDVLHVAAALRHGAGAFGTFDKRQAGMAEEAGLKLLR